MISKEKLDRINELSRKKKEEGLTEEEAKERVALHEEYLNALRANIKSQLDLIKIVDPDDDPENWTPEQRENAAYLTEKLGQEFDEQNERDRTFRQTLNGNPSNPTGKDGLKMIERMNEEHRELTDWGLSFYNGPLPKNILDIGCGGGAALDNLHRRYPLATVYGIDISEVSVEKSLEYNREGVIEDKIRIHQGDVTDLPFGDNFFELIISVSSYFFWPDFDTAVEQIKRVLTPGGTLLLMGMTNKDLELDPQQEYVRDNLMTNFFSSDEFKKIFTEAGFSSVEVYTKEGTHFVCVEAKK